MPRPSDVVMGELVKVREQLLRERARERKRSGWTNPAVDGLTVLYAELKAEHAAALDVDERARKDAFFAARRAEEAAAEEEASNWRRVIGNRWGSMGRQIWDPEDRSRVAGPNVSSLKRDGFDPWGRRG